MEKLSQSLYQRQRNPIYELSIDSSRDTYLSQHIFLAKELFYFMVANVFNENIRVHPYNPALRAHPVLLGEYSLAVFGPYLRVDRCLTFAIRCA